MQTTIFKAIALATVLLSTDVFAQTNVAAAAKQSASASQVHVLTRSEFDALAAHPERVLVLDVRRPDEISAIGGFAAYLSIQSADLEKHLAYLPKDRAIVTVSNHAGRAKRAAELLTDRGFKVAGALGAQDYEAEGGKLVKIEPPAKSNPAK